MNVWCLRWSATESITTLQRHRPEHRERVAHPPARFERAVGQQAMEAHGHPDRGEHVHDGEDHQVEGAAIRMSQALQRPGGTAVEQLGTAVEYLGLGYVEHTALGSWQATTGATRSFRMKNFVFDSVGELSATAFETSSVKLSSTLNSFSGSGTAKIYDASGTLIDTETFTITGTRF